MEWLTNALGVTAVGLGTLYLGYKTYGKFLARRIFGLDDTRETPAYKRQDGVDFVPTHPAIVFGHHFASIAGLGPIVGPAIAVYWGWVPALLWIVFGCIVVGGVHDFATLFASLRHDGRTIGDLTYDIVNGRARVLFLIIIFFLLALAMGVFALLMAKLFVELSPQAVVPTFTLILIAMAFGILTYRLRWPLGWMTLAGVVLMFVATLVGLEYPVAPYRVFLQNEKVKQIIETTDDPAFPHVNQVRGTRAGEVAAYFIAKADTDPAYAGMAADVEAASQKTKDGWSYLLLVYAFIASVLPVWLLLQPRDYINSYQLYIGLFMLTLGIIVWHPQIVGPAFGPPVPPTPTESSSTPGPWPFLFITIACGAVSGFHNIVSSGTTARQVRKESDARLIGYGAMLTEGVLALLVVMVCVAGLSSEEFATRYGSWEGLDLRAMGSFLTGASHVLAKPFTAFLPASNHATVVTFCYNFIAVVVVSFAMTTLDTGTRLLRFNIEAIGKLVRVPVLGNRYLASLIAVVAIGYFALMKIGGKPAGVTLWHLFGTTNQLLAVIGLLVAAVYLHQLKRPVVFLVFPMLLMLFSVTWAMLIKIGDFYDAWKSTHDAGNGSLLLIAVALVIMTVWIVIEATLVFFRGRPSKGVPVQTPN